MNTWAKERADCNFLCVCVVGDASAQALAREMSSEMKLTDCVNGFIDNEQDMPTYGQLGCKGFIILDAEHRVVSASTSVFMQVRDLAFRHVEALLDAVCAKRPLPKVCPGESIVLQQAPAQRPELKGCQGICVKIDGASVHFGFMSGPLKGRVAEFPIEAVGPLVPTTGGYTSGCAPGSCSDGSCAQMQMGDGTCGDGSCDSTSCGDGKGADCDSMSCGSAGGGCKTAGGCDEAGTCLSENFVKECLNVVSVKVQSMDDEHAECIAALRTLVDSRARSSLEAALRCLGDHFSHEEALFEEYGFGAHSNANLSAAKSHAEEHRRILDTVRAWLAENSGRQDVPPQFIRAVLLEFHEHTSRYDTQYAEPLSAKGAN